MCTAVVLVLDPWIKDPGTVGDALPWKRLLSYFECFPAHLPCKKPRTHAQQWRLFLILGSRTPVLLGMCCPERDYSPILSVSLPTFPAKSLGHVHSSGACSRSSDQGPRYCWGCIALKETPLPFWVFPCPPFSLRKNILLHALFPEERSCECPPFGNFHLPPLFINNVLVMFI